LHVLYQKFFSCVNAKEWDRISKITQTPLSLQRSINQSRLPGRSRIGSARTALFRDDGHKLVALQNDGSLTPIKARDQNAEISPEPNIVRAQPPSILKSDNRKSRLPSTARCLFLLFNFNDFTFLAEKPKIRFSQSLFTTERIPSRFEKFVKKSLLLINFTKLRETEEMKNTSFSNFAEFSPTDSSPTSSRSAASRSTGPGTDTKKETTPKKKAKNKTPSPQKILRRSPRRHR